MKQRRTNPSRQNTQLPDPFLEVGRIVRPHGVRGQVVIESDAAYFAELPEDTVLFLQPQDLEVTVRSVRSHQGRFLVTLDGYTSREEADELRDLRVCLNSRDLPELGEDEYFFWQLIGLKVRVSNGIDLGTVTDIIETGANDVYIVHDENGRERLIPAIKDVINEISLDSGFITVTPLPGLFPEDLRI